MAPRLPAAGCTISTKSLGWASRVFVKRLTVAGDIPVSLEISRLSNLGDVKIASSKAMEYLDPVMSLKIGFIAS